VLARGVAAMLPATVRIFEVVGDAITEEQGEELVAALATSRRGSAFWPACIGIHPRSRTLLVTLLNTQTPSGTPWG
jgi:hypothetical protein